MSKIVAAVSIGGATIFVGNLLVVAPDPTFITTILGLGLLGLTGYGVHKGTEVVLEQKKLEQEKLKQEKLKQEKLKQEKLNAEDKEKREMFTKQFVKQASEEYPDYNVVIVHPSHKVSGESIIHQHRELQINVGTIGYKIYFSRKGTPFELELQGDDGYMNLAYAGDFTWHENILRA